jgi:hypothetical protein
MSFNPEDIPLIPNNWFSTSISYEGRGRAEFQDPPAAVEGEARVSFDESGSLCVELRVEEVISEQPLRLGLIQLFSGQKPVEFSGGVGISGGGEPPNLCTKLTVTTDHGVFSAPGDRHYSYGVELFSGNSGSVTFTPLRSQFDAAGKDQPHYWVMPLTNFLSRLISRHPVLDRHPLRIYPTPVVPDGLEGEDAFIAEHNANLKNRLITFEFMGGPGFIEALPDYDQRAKNLTEGRERHSVTAVMVGEVGARGIEQADLEGWFPDDLLRVLSIVTGTPVGAPWIEFRDARGELIRRVHVKLNLSPFSQGHRPLEEGAHSGTGYLLTKYLSSPDRGESYLNVVLKHLFHVARYGQSLEDKFVYLARAFENLCQRYGFKARDLMKSLDPNWQQAVKAILSTAANQIQDEARAAARAGQFDQSRTLDSIAERTERTPGGKENSFGLAVTELLRHFSLPDADIVDAHYLANPRPDGIPTWSAVLSKYRGAPVHTGFFNISGKEHDADDVRMVETHLHDMLLRIIFKIIGYDGTYQPPVKTLLSDTPVDWVVPSLPAQELGYK